MKHVDNRHNERIEAGLCASCERPLSDREHINCEECRKADRLVRRAQAELPLVERFPTVGSDMARLCAWLKEHPGRHSAVRLCAALRVPTNESGKRRVRAAAEYSQGAIISGPGIQYIHADHATADEAEAAAACHESQGKKHLSRAKSIRLYQRRKLH